MLEGGQATMYRAVAARANYLAQDRTVLLIGIKCTCLSVPMFCLQVCLYGHMGWCLLYVSLNRFACLAMRLGVGLGLGRALSGLSVGLLVGAI